MLPIPPGIRDQCAVPVDQGVIDRDDALVAVAGGGVLLELLQPPRIECQHVPRGRGEEAIEAGLIGRLGELALDARDGLALGDEQSGEVLGEVAAPGLVGEEVAVVIQGLVGDGGEFDVCMGSHYEDHLRRAPGSVLECVVVGP